jgi:hypothetical protein
MARGGPKVGVVIETVKGLCDFKDAVEIAVQVRFVTSSSSRFRSKSVPPST